jgi:very-short-patch-repair endonuclease
VADDSLKTTDPRWRSASQRDRRILAAARAQRQLLTTAQLRATGFSAGAIQYRCESGRLFRVHPGVYSLSPPPFATEQLLLGAALACGSGSVVSDDAAGWLLGLLASVPELIDVTNEKGKGRDRAGIRVHRRTLERCDITWCRRIPTTTATRTVVDLAATRGPAEIERILLLASSRRLINDRRLTQLLDARQGRPGAPALRAVLGSAVPRVRSPVEVTYLRICRDAGIEEPLINRPVAVAGRTFEVDFQWPRLRMIVEVDGYAFHGGRSRANADRDRDQLLAVGGWDVHRFTRDQIVRDPAEVRRRTRALLARAERSLAGNH